MKEYEVICTGIGGSHARAKIGTLKDERDGQPVATVIANFKRIYELLGRQKDGAEWDKMAGDLELRRKHLFYVSFRRRLANDGQTWITGRPTMTADVSADGTQTFLFACVRCRIPVRLTASEIDEVLEQCNGVAYLDIASRY